MNKKNMKKSVAIVTAMVMVLMMAGCGDSATTNEEGTYGQVSALSDTSMTISVGTMENKTVSGGAMGARPDGVSGGAMGARPEGVSGGAMKARPDGVSGGAIDDKPDDQMPSGSAAPDGNEKRGNLFGGFQTTGESKNVTIDGDTEFYIQSNQTENTKGSIADISMGSLVSVVFAEDGVTAVKITVMNMGGMKGNRNGNGTNQSGSDNTNGGNYNKGNKFGNANSNAGV